MATANRIPVTVLTGYLGAGKTTLLNRILSQQHGRRYAVIVNEFGEIGIDGDLILNSDEELFEMNNGCICCTVRGDLIRTMHGLLAKESRFDGIMVETTGLADPGPVAQTFFVDGYLRSKTELEFGHDRGRRQTCSPAPARQPRGARTDRFRRSDHPEQDRSRVGN